MLEPKSPVKHSAEQIRFIDAVLAVFDSRNLKIKLQKLENEATTSLGITASRAFITPTEWQVAQWMYSRDRGRVSSCRCGRAI